MKIGLLSLLVSLFVSQPATAQIVGEPPEAPVVRLPDWALEPTIFVPRTRQDNCWTLYHEAFLRAYVKFMHNEIGIVDFLAALDEARFDLDDCLRMARWYDNWPEGIPLVTPTGPMYLP